MANKQGLKRKIKSVESIHKITSAMELIATAKLNKQKQSFQSTLEYASGLKELMSKVIDNLNEPKNPYLQGSVDGKVLYILYSSDLGLCGGYNMNMVKLLQSEMKQGDEVIVFGSKGKGILKSKKIEVIDSYGGEDIPYEVFSNLTKSILTRYRKQEISSIKLVCTSFVNTITFSPVIHTILPLVHEKKEQTVGALWEFEPSSSSILNQMMPMVVSSLMNSYFLETKVSEQASRRLAMENATDNAEELEEKYTLQYNQARQAAITQEISEIVGGANAL